MKASAGKGKAVKSAVKNGGKAVGKALGKGKMPVAVPKRKAALGKATPKPKPVSKTVVKPATKSPSKPGAKPEGKPKTNAKTAIKPAAKPIAKVKASVKLVSKPVVKAKSNKAVKASSKTSVKLVVAKKPAKAATKPVSKPTKPAAKPVVKAAPSKKMAPPFAVPSAPKASASDKTKKVNVVVEKSPPAPVKSAAKTVAKTVAKSTPAPVAVAPLRAVPEPVAPVAAPLLAPGAVFQKSGRPSSRLAQLTVPSMAQSVASTAAKSSFTQTTVAPLITPPLASAVKKDPKLANNWKTKTAEQLSNAELIAMPDSEYMNEKQMAAFRLKLLTLRLEILNSAGETTEHLREDTVVVPDPADRATIEEEHALELRTRDRERKLLKKIEQSIHRIDSGDYCYCDETGEAIGVPRLIARPTATLSLEAQQRRELKQKMFGD